MPVKRIPRFLAGLLLLAASSVHLTASAQSAICYNCPPEWADWGSQLKAINTRLGIQVPSDNKNSGQSIAALIAEKANPVADVVYLGGIAVRNDWVKVIHRPDRCDWSLFRLGLALLDHFLNEFIPIPVSFNMLEKNCVR